MIKSAMAPATMQVMTMRRRGLQKAGLLSGGGVGEDAMVVGCRMARRCDFFLTRLDGFLHAGGN
jgi:hypothetical protein